MRKILFIVCIATVIVAGVAANAELFALPLAPLDPLVGLVVLLPVPEPIEIPPTTAPVLHVVSPRPPPQD
jgi:hypothetical protein